MGWEGDGGGNGWNGLRECLFKGPIYHGVWSLWGFRSSTTVTGWRHFSLAHSTMHKAIAFHFNIACNQPSNHSSLLL